MENKKEKSPAVRWYPKDILTSVRVLEMDMVEECAYRRALDICWLNETLPADPEKLARVIGKGCSTTVAAMVATMFTPDPNNPGRLIHDRLEKERAKQQEWSDKSSEGGKKSAEARRKKAEEQRQAQEKVGEEENKGGSTTLAPLVKDSLQPKGNFPFPVSISPTNKNIGGGKPPQTAANSPPNARESDEEYLERKKREHPRLDVPAVYADFVSKCGSEKYPNLKNTRRSFDKWLETEDPPIVVETGKKIYTDPKTGKGLV